MTYQSITNHTLPALQVMTKAIDVGKWACSATLDLNIALAQQGWRAAIVVPGLGVQVMQTLLVYSVQFPLYGMRVWQHYLSQASQTLQQPDVALEPYTAQAQPPEALPEPAQQPDVALEPYTAQAQPPEALPEPVQQPDVALEPYTAQAQPPEALPEPVQQPDVALEPYTAQAQPPEALPEPVQQPIVTVGPNTSFYFRGPENRLNLPAGNLAEFSQLAEEIDDATWQYHLRRGDYSHWFQSIWQDEELTATAVELEHAELSAHESRARIQELIAQRYALPI